MKVKISLVFIFFLLTKGFSQSPGGVGNSTTNILWLKADAGITGATPVTAWADQSGNGNNSSDVDGPDFITDRINFNPSLQFDGNSEEFILSLSNGKYKIRDKIGESIY